ncbi:MAG: FAD-dependent oxidoreductase, partial [Deltaproteobacteria bacterium]|nr:FAD-dependent oxidoreductase [Deltaproteobacteria bacterium]
NFEIPERTVDLLVIGLGPAGVAAALQACRDGLDVFCVGDEPVGGLVRAARRLDNLPAAAGIKGIELASKMASQFEAAAVPHTFAHVSNLGKNSDKYLARFPDGRQCRARSTVLASGTRPREWSHSVSLQQLHRDARTLPERLASKRVVLIGGGEAALDTALTCSDRQAQVTVLARGSGMRAVERLTAEAQAAGVQILTQTEVLSVSGGPGEWRLVCHNDREFEADLLVVCIGRIPRNELLQELTGGVDLPNQLNTDIPGLFLAGDLIRGRERYVATAMGDGQRAALAAAKYLAEENK